MSDTLIQALAVGALIYFGARWLVSDKPRFRLRVIKGGKK